MKKTCLLMAILAIGLCHRSFAANRFWIASTASNWNNTANWAATSGGAGGQTVPGATDNVTFDNKGLGNCTLDIVVSVTKFTVSAGYTGTIFQNSHSFLASGNAVFSDGTFSGGSANITFAKRFTLSGGTFISTTAIVEFDANTAFTSGTFSHNNGTAMFNATTGNITISGTSPAFYILQFVGEGNNYVLSSTGNITVSHSLNLTGSLPYNLNTGTLAVSGDINVTNTASGCAGTALVEIVGAGVQNFSGSSAAGQGALPQLTIDKPSGTLNLSNYPASSNNFTYTAGTVNAGTSTFSFTDGSANPYTISGSLALNNVTFFALTNATFTIPATTTLTVNGSLGMAGTNKITLNTGTLDVYGNITLANTATTGGGSALIDILGGAAQVMDGTAITAGENLLPFITINKTGGTLTLKGNISESADWTYTAGTVDAASNASTVIFGGNNLNLTSAGMSFYNATVTGNTITLLNNLTVTNNVNITGGKIVAGTNTINLAGNWNDYGTAGFTEGTGTVNLNGSALQTITSPGGENFNNLTINNSGSGIQLLNNTAVASTLTMTQGNVDLSGNALTLGSSTVNTGTLNYTNGTMINTGSFTRWFNKNVAIAGVAGLFPMGTSANYRPLNISTTAAPTTGGTISVTYTDAPTNSAVSFADGGSTVLVRKDLNWAITTTNLVGGTYNLEAQGTGFGLVGNVSDLRLTLANSVTGTAGVNAGTTSDPQVNRTGLSLANLGNTFYIGSVNTTTSPLPITLISFTGSVVDDAVILDWSTSSETDNAWFIVQRSKDGSVWEDLDKIAGAGTSSAIHAYSAKDQNPGQGASYYRLEQVDQDGKTSYSSILSFTLGSFQTGIVVYPVPAKSLLNIGFPTQGSYEVNLVNSSGQRVMSRTASAGSTLVLDVTGLSAGVYFVRIMRQGQVVTSRAVLIGK